MATNYPKPILPLSKADIRRFWSKVDKRGPDDCWPWLAGVTKDGYGRFTYRPSGGAKEEHKSPRIAYYLTTGDDPGRDLRVLHSCDNSRCCQPNHLRKGTVQDNVRDREERGRTARGDQSGSRLHPEKVRRGDSHPRRLNPEIALRGSAHGMAILNEEKVLEIRARYAAGEKSYKTLAAAYQVNPWVIAAVIKRIHWRHI